MHWIAIVWSGFIATTLAAAFFWVVRSLEWSRFSPSEQLGCLFLRDPTSPATETVGFFLLLALGSTLLPYAYQLLLELWSGPTWLKGAAIGLLHGSLFVAVLPVLGTISACVRGGYLPPPGRFGLKWGVLTPVGLLLGHSLYGGVVGAILAAFSQNPQGGAPAL